MGETEGLTCILLSMEDRTGRIAEYERRELECKLKE